MKKLSLIFLTVVLFCSVRAHEFAYALDACDYMFEHDEEVMQKMGQMSSAIIHNQKVIVKNSMIPQEHCASRSHDLLYAQEAHAAIKNHESEVMQIVGDIAHAIIHNQGLIVKTQLNNDVNCTQEFMYAHDACQLFNNSPIEPLRMMGKMAHAIINNQALIINKHKGAQQKSLECQGFLYAQDAYDSIMASGIQPLCMMAKILYAIIHNQEIIMIAEPKTMISGL